MVSYNRNMTAIQNYSETPPNIPEFKVFIYLMFNFYNPKSIISVLIFLHLKFYSI